MLQAPPAVNQVGWCMGLLMSEGEPLSVLPMCPLVHFLQLTCAVEGSSQSHAPAARTTVERASEGLLTWAAHFLFFVFVFFCLRLVAAGILVPQPDQGLILGPYSRSVESQPLDSQGINSLAAHFEPRSVCFEQELPNFSWKGLDSNSRQLCWLCGLCHCSVEACWRV